MRKFPYRVIVFLISFIFLALNVADAGVFRWIRVGRYQSKVTDAANYGESAPGRYFDYYYHPGDRDYPFARQHSHAIGWYVGAANWSNSDGTVTGINKISGPAHGTSSEAENTMPVPDANNVTIFKYHRYPQVSIIVDGVDYAPDFLEGEEVNAAKIPGTADVMVESWVNTSMGLTLHQKVLAWSQINHDQYHIFDWTFTNTGNTDLDTDIELPDQTLTDLYFLRVTFWKIARGYKDPWEGDYGWFLGDTLRIMYKYPGRSKGGDYDDTGGVYDPASTRTTVIRDPAFAGEAYLHVDSSASIKTDAITQPYVTGYYQIDDPYSKKESHSNPQATNDIMYSLMSEGFSGCDLCDGGVNEPDVVGTYPGTHHSAGLDSRGEAYVFEIPWYVWLPGSHAAMGPYTLAPDDSIRFVFARVMGSISYEKAWEIGEQFRAGTADDNWDAAANGPLDETNTRLMPPYVDNYSTLITDDNALAKDLWILTGKDSLFKNASAAQWNVRNDYEVPLAPRAPSIEVTSEIGKINITWGSESEADDDFAGYKVYRTIGRYDSTMWEIADFPGDGTHEYDDITAERGQPYYYYVAAYDDGSNAIDWHGKSEVLESGRYLNQTTFAAYKMRVPGTTFDDIRVVPNPFNLAAAELQYPGDPNKIMFLEIPAYCTIRIYTESGDLVKVLEHDSGTGDESWGVLDEEHSTTETGQLIVSGIYVAFIQERDSAGKLTGEDTFVKFVVVR